MRAHVIVPDDLIAEVDKLVGPRKRSEFFVEAVREKLRRDRLMAAAEAAAGSLIGVDIPGWETSESAAEWVREQRRESDRRVNEMGWGTPAAVAKDNDPDAP
jgi:metal-responsive CopG/Arc/MetJ family transcriptional regulator